MEFFCGVDCSIILLFELLFGPFGECGFVVLSLAVQKQIILGVGQFQGSEGQYGYGFCAFEFHQVSDIGHVIIFTIKYIDRVQMAKIKPLIHLLQQSIRMFYEKELILDKDSGKSKQQGTSGKSLKYVEEDISKFYDYRENDSQLKNIGLEDYFDDKGLEQGFIKLLIIKGKGIYKNKRIKIKIHFPETYPFQPPQMYFLPFQGKTFLHANVYRDNGQICHHLLQKDNNSVKNRKLTLIIKQIHKFIYAPNFKNAANLTLSDLYQKSRDEYEKQIKLNASFLEDVDQEQISDSQNDSQLSY